MVAALVVGLTGGLLLSGPDEAPSRTSLASVAIDGPAQVTVGEEVTFTASVSGMESWIWTLPSGRYVPDLPTVTITARTPGPSHLTLRGQDADGKEIEAVHELTVTE